MGRRRQARWFLAFGARLRIQRSFRRSCIVERNPASTSVRRHGRRLRPPDHPNAGALSAKLVESPSGAVDSGRRMHRRLPMRRITASGLLLVWSCTLGFACSSQLDCMSGSKCVKGVCIGGMSPGNANDIQPVAPSGPEATAGNPCSLDLDCGIGSRCLKAGHVHGTCMPRRH